MAAKRVDYEIAKPRIIADWRTGAFTIQALAQKYKVSVGFVHKLISGVSHDMKPLVKKIVEVNQELAAENEFCVNAVKEVALDRVRFECKNNARMELVAMKAMELLDSVDKPADVSPIMGVLKTHREAILGRQPDTAIQINNNDKPRGYIVTPEQAKSMDAWVQSNE